MYSDQSQIKIFKKFSKNHGSLRGYFGSYLGENLAKSAYGRSKVVDEIFYIGDPRKQRSLLSDYDLKESSKLSEEELNENQTLQLINDYLSRIDFRSKDSQFKIKTIIAIFLRRSFRDYYYKLEMPKKYATLTKDVYKGIITARVKILKDLRTLLLGVLDGSIASYRNMDTNPIYIANTFMKSDIEITDTLYEMVTSESTDLDIFDEGSPEATIDAMGLGILSARTERICSKKVFPKANNNQLKLMRKILMDYHNLWLRFDPIEIKIMCYMLDLGASTYSNYKTKISKDLIKLSNQQSYEDIIPYLMEDEQE